MILCNCTCLHGGLPKLRRCGNLGKLRAFYRPCNAQSRTKTGRIAFGPMRELRSNPAIAKRTSEQNTFPCCWNWELSRKAASVRPTRRRRDTSGGGLGTATRFALGNTRKSFESAKPESVILGDRFGPVIKPQSVTLGDRFGPVAKPESVTLGDRFGTATWKYLSMEAPSCRDPVRRASFPCYAVPGFACLAS